MSSNTRRLYLVLLLPLLLLFAQQAALTHEFSHFASPQSQAPKQDKKLPGNSFCPDCVAFAQLAGAMPCHIAPLVAIAVDHFAVHRGFVALLATKLALQRNRGPPFFL